MASRTAAWCERHPERCREYHRRYRLNKRYGLTVEKYDEMLADQGGGCAICGVTSSENARPLDVDHDHGTGKVRGLLCSACNYGIGRLGEDPARIRAAADYVEQHAAA